VVVKGIQEDQSPPQQVYDPSHPDADANGYVALPNVNVVQEMVNMITASRAYEAGVTVMQTVKGMARSALSIGG
jgi:flagellar basal-body rod protein FlgC